MKFSPVAVSALFAVAALALSQGCATKKPPAAPVPRQGIAAAAPETPDEAAKRLLAEAKAFENGYRLKPGHEEKLREALAVPGITEKMRQQISGDLVRKVFCLDNETAYAKAKDLLNPVLSDPSLTNASDRIAYTVMLADGAFRSSMPDEAKRLVDALWDLPGLKWWDTNAVFNARVGIDLKMCDYASARAAYRKVFGNPLEPHNRRWDCLKACVGLWSEDRLYDEGIEALSAWDWKSFGHRFDAASLQCRLLREKGDYSGIEKLAGDIAADTYASERDRTLAKEFRLAELLRSALDRNDLDAALEFLRADAGVYLNAVNPLNSIVSDVLKMAETRQDWDKVIEITEIKPGYEFKWGFNWMIRDGFLRYYRALSARGRGKDIPVSIAKILGTGKVPAQDAAMLSVIAGRFLSGKTDNAAISKAVGGLEPKAKLGALANAAKFLVSVGDRENALAVYRYRQSLMIERKRNLAHVPYVKDAPVDIGSWFASGLVERLEKHSVDVPYSQDEAAKLILDVSVQRDVSKSGGESETCFYVCWDETGVHLLFIGMDKEWRKVLEGSLGGTGYEMYMCFGEGAPTYQWIMDDQVKGKTSYYDYASQGKRYRPLKDHVVAYSSPIEGGFATAMNISWTACYERLPDNGTAWPFEMIHWSRGGGVTWGGETIWQNSRWGRWIFKDFTQERKTAIMRSLLNGAAARFRAQSAVGSGEITHWKDRELGDPVFYNEVLRPFAEKLEADAKLVTPDASPETIARIYKESMGPMYDFKYYADEIRERYLREKFTEE